MSELHVVEHLSIQCVNDARVTALIPMPEPFFVALNDRDWKALKRNPLLPAYLRLRLWRMLGHADAPPKKMQLLLSTTFIMDVVDNYMSEIDPTFRPKERRREDLPMAHSDLVLRPSKR